MRAAKNERQVRRPGISDDISPRESMGFPAAKIRQ